MRSAVVLDPAENLSWVESGELVFPVRGKFENCSADIMDAEMRMSNRPQCASPGLVRQVSHVTKSGGLHTRRSGAVPSATSVIMAIS